MSAQDPPGSPPSKRRKLDVDLAATAGCTPPPTEIGATSVKALGRPISPPLSRRRRSRTPPPSTPRLDADAQLPSEAPAPSATGASTTGPTNNSTVHYVKSPIQLTKIKDLTPHQNVDTVGLGDLLGDPMIKECWNFNYLFDLDFVMQQLDPDVKSLVKMRIVHGFWKREDERRLQLMMDAERYPNIDLISAYIPDPFGTHHSKMMIIFRHDDLVQIVIHTANMIARDWTNMTQAVWTSPLLPLQTLLATTPKTQGQTETHLIGTGERFKTDLRRYLEAYGKRLDDLTNQLQNHDFSAIRAAFLGSAPSRQKPSTARPLSYTSFGWLGLKEILSGIPISSARSADLPSDIIMQVSSIATLGQTTNWLTHFQSVLSRSLTATASEEAPRAFNEASFFTRPSISNTKATISDPTFNIIFPTAQEIRTSLDGYASGASIHTKIQSVAQQKQVEYLRPLLRHWRHTASDRPNQPNVDPIRREAHRGHAAPHIKTYIRFSNAERKSIDWALVTSANLSKQAWGELENKKKEEVWIQSYETGVVIWPQLYAINAEEVGMVPTFGKDTPDAAAVDGIVWQANGQDVEGQTNRGKMVVGFRMPYDLPLAPYGSDEVPWCATLPDNEPDWMGRAWSGY